MSSGNKRWLPSIHIQLLLLLSIRTTQGHPWTKDSFKRTHKWFPTLFSPSPLPTKQVLPGSLVLQEPQECLCVLRGVPVWFTNSGFVVMVSKWGTSLAWNCFPSLCTAGWLLCWTQVGISNVGWVAFDGLSPSLSLTCCLPFTTRIGRREGKKGRRKGREEGGEEREKEGKGGWREGEWGINRRERGKGGEETEWWGRGGERVLCSSRRNNQVFSDTCVLLLSAVPFLSRLLPSDVCKIYKSGSCVR